MIMKKLFNGKFLFILALSIMVLIILVLGAFYLFDDNDDVFVKSGYVLNPLSEKVEKYFFNENVGYHTNLSSMVEFKDVDDKDVMVLKDSFLHYMDNSLSFLKNGAILDLDSVKGNGTVVFYNITNKSIINKNNEGYLIETNGEDIKLNNFMGRISDNKYIVVGNVKAKIPGNEKLIEGDYFEIVYVEEGIVNIENKDVKYQVAADETYLYVGSLVINLRDKKISLGDEDVMSITAITIDGNENVEIIPKAPEDSSSGSGTGTGSGNGSGSGTGSGSGSGTGTGDGSGDGTGGNGGSGSGGSGGSGGVGEPVRDLLVSLKGAKVGSTSVSVIFDIYNKRDDDKFMLKVMNVDTGRTIDMVAEVVEGEEITVNLLSPKTRYLFTVVNESDEGKYFQKIFETNDFGINMERSYATDSLIAYKVNVDENTDITNAKLTLYKFNEDTMKNEVVKSSYVDENGETKYVDKSVWIKNIDTTKEVVFDGLDSNTIYTAVLDEFSLESSNFKDIYNITLTSMTLKKTPKFGNMEAKDIETGSFKLSLGSVEDVDNAITSYTYLVYENDNPNETVIKPIVKSNASPVEIKIGDGEDELKNDTNYFYKVVIEYFDNEKYVEYTTGDRINFVMGSDPKIRVVPNEEEISYNTIGATLYLTDNSCLINMPNREKCASETSSTVVTVKKNSINGEVIVFSKVVDFSIVDKDIKYDLFVNGLQEGTQYSIEVSAILNNDPSGKRVEIMHTDNSVRTITTKTLASFMAIFPAEDKLNSSANHVVNQRVKLEAATDNTGTLTPEETAKTIKKVVISLYEGSHLEDIKVQDPLVAPKVIMNSDNVNIKELLYDNYYTITTDETFGLDIDDLRALGKDGKLSPTYTIMIRAYYDIDEVNEVKISNNVMVYSILESLLLENVEDPIIITKEINNETSGYAFDKLKDKGTVVGYSVNAVYDRKGLVANGLIPQNINIYVYNEKRERVKFYIKDKNNKLMLVDKITDDISGLEIGNYLTEIYMDYGTEYGNVDTVMSRGNSYYIGYEVEVSTDSGNILYPSNKSEDAPSDYGVYEHVANSLKETPNLKMYIAKSTKDSITYRYQIYDPDKAIYRESVDGDYGLYYVINSLDEKKVKINKIDEDNYQGDITIIGLNNKDNYSLYYKKNVMKSGQIDKDIVNYLDGEDNGEVLFDGYYDVNDSKYNFSYQVINNPLTDNKVTFKIMASEEILERILSYKVKFSDTKGNTLDKEVWELDLCSENDTVKRCFSVDYIDLKNAGMKSDKRNTNTISTSIEAIYDTGLMGFDYTVGEGKDYPYMILQNNNKKDEYGKYIVFKNDGKIGLYDESLNIGRGYYNYSFNNEKRTSLFYKSMFNSSHKSNINNIVLSSTGYTSNYGIINPKMVSTSMLKCSDNTFSFSSITPKVKVSQRTGLVDGAIMGLSLSGADLTDLRNEGTDKAPEYYLYVDVWNNYDDAIVNDTNKTVRPRIKVRVDNSNPGKMIEALIDGLKSLNSGEEYYFNVYAYLYKNNKYEFTQLFDEGIIDKYQAKTYSFGTKNGESLYTSREINYQVSEEVYGNRILNTKINLTKYQNNYPYNFDVMYMICYDETCTRDEGYIFKKEISRDKVDSQIVSTEDITKYDLEYNKNYNIMIYAVAKEYVKNADGSFSEGVQYVNLVSTRDKIFKLSKLREPSFVVSRKAGYADGKYYIDFTINVNDLDKTIVGGKYYVKLIDTSGNVVGKLQEVNENGDYVDIDNYSEYAMDANVLNKKIRVTNLDMDTKYSIVVYGDAYVNNYDIEVPKEERTYEVKTTHTIYTTDTYGVTFGHDISYVITDNSYIVLFRSGTNFDNVVRVNYSVSLDDEFNPGVIASGSDEIGEEYKFEFNDESGYGMYVMTRKDGIKNTLGKYYLITLSFDVKDPEDESKTINLTAAYNPRFTDSVAYVKDMDKNN